MSNPARELLELFDSWTVPAGTSARTVRAEAARRRGTSFEEETKRAVRLIDELERRLDGLENAGFDMAVERGIIPTLYEALLCGSRGLKATPQTGWKCLPDHERAMLSAIATHLDMAGTFGAPTPEARERVAEAIDAAASFVNEAGDINDATREHLSALLAEIRDAALSGDATVFAPKVAEFVGTATIIGETKNSQPWRAMVRDFIVQVAAGVTTSVLMVGATAIAGAITGV